MYAKDFSEPNYEFLIKKCEDIGIKQLNDPKAFIECSNTMNDVYENIDDYNPTSERKILIVFDDMIAGIMTNKTFQSIILKNYLLDVENGIFHFYLSPSLIILFQKVSDSTQHIIRS